jgi:hypothetical protein
MSSIRVQLKGLLGRGCGAGLTAELPSGVLQRQMWPERAPAASVYSIPARERS